jgi:hypothetical protein
MINNSTNPIKLWNEEEEKKLVEEINELKNITEIVNNHKRTTKAITMRIEKILNESKYKELIKNISEIKNIYLTKESPKYKVDYNLVYENILKYKTLQQIAETYNINVIHVKKILEFLVKKENIEMPKLLRIKSLLNSEDNMELGINTLANSESISNLESLMLSMLNEFKILKTDIFDLRNRVKIIMEAVDKKEKKHKKDKKNKNVDGDTIITSSIKNKKSNKNIIEDNDDSDNSSIKTNSKKNKKNIIVFEENIEINNKNEKLCVDK